MTDQQIRAIIKQTAPRLNANAVDRMFFDLKLGHLFPGNKMRQPKTSADVKAETKRLVAQAHAEAKKHPISGMKWDGITMLNEAADEMAFEAMAS
jgi:hypothetical protein